MPSYIRHALFWRAVNYFPSRRVRSREIAPNVGGWGVLPCDVLRCGPTIVRCVWVRQTDNAACLRPVARGPRNTLSVQLGQILRAGYTGIPVRFVIFIVLGIGRVENIYIYIYIVGDTRTILQHYNNWLLWSALYRIVFLNGCLLVRTNTKSKIKPDIFKIVILN